MKYGALSTERGRVLVTWQMQGSNLHLEWVERGGPVVQQTGHQGFGSALILEALTYEFQAQCTLEFEPRGVAARFVIPLTDGENETAETYAPPVEAFTLELRPFNALVLEDDYVISREAREMLKELGASDVQAVSTIEGALEQLGTQKFDFILLDANIHGQFSEKAALRCVELGVPFAFATGYGSKDQQLHDLGGVGVLTKPMQKTELMSVLLKAGLSEKQH